jgi:hypothetical protein
MCKSKVPTDHDIGFYPKPDKSSPSNYFISLTNTVTWISPLRRDLPSALRSKIPQVFHLSHACCFPFPSNPPCSHHHNGTQWTVGHMEIRNGFHSDQKFRKFSTSTNPRRTETKSISSCASNGWFMLYNKRPATSVVINSASLHNIQNKTSPSLLVQFIGKYFEKRVTISSVFSSQLKTVNLMYFWPCIIV